MFIFIHFFEPGSIALWKETIQLFGDDFQIIAIDLPGHGNSTGLDAPYCISDIAYIVQDFLKKLHINHCHIVGASYGACVALELALYFPLTPLTLTLIGATSSIKKNLTYKKRIRKCINVFPMHFIAKFIAFSILPGKKFKELRKTVEKAIALNNKKRYIDAFQAISQFHIEEKALKTISTPSLIIHGEKDLIFDIEEALFLSNSLPNASFFLAHSCHHLPFLENPLQIVSLIKDFIFNHQKLAL